MKAIIFSIFISLSFMTWGQGLDGVVVEKFYLTNAADQANALSNNAVTTLEVGTTTYRVYIDMAAGYKFSQLYGNADHNLVVSTTTNFYNDPNYGVAVNPATVSVNNIRKHTAMIDSWFTTGGAAATKTGVIKTEDTDGALVNLQGVLANNPGGCYGLPITGVGAQDGLVPSNATTYIVPNTLGLGTALNVLDQTPGNSIVISNGSIAALGGVVGPTAANRVLVAQFTTKGDLSFQFNVQLVNIATGAAENYVASNPSAGELTHPTLTFSPNTPPVVSITNPTNNSSVPVGDVLLIQANATDAVGSINSVEFFVDGVSVFLDTQAPYTYSYIPTAGAHNVYAVAVDSDCVSTTSSTVNFNAISNLSPTISISGPSTAIAGTNVTYTAVPNDTDGTIQQVEFFLNNQSIFIDQTAPYEVTFEAELGSNQLIRAEATDNLGAVGNSNVVSLNVVANTPPQVSIVDPMDNSLFIAPAQLTFSASANDVDGQVSEVTFYLNDEIIGTDNNLPYSISWTSVPGEYTLYAMATDNLGAITTSSSISFVVADPNALPYEVSNITVDCNSEVICLPISTSALYSVNDVIGFDLDVAFDASKLEPTGVFNISSDLIDPTNAEVIVQNVETGLISFSIVLNGSAPAGTSFTGGGSIGCVEFVRSAGFSPIDETTVDVLFLQESYASGVEAQGVNSGMITSEINTNYEGNVSFWFDGSPLSYDAANPNDYLATTIEGVQEGIPSGVITNTDLNGDFNFDLNQGNEVLISRDILGSTAVQPIVNGADIVLAKTIVADGGLVPSVFELLAMDVNLDGVISAGDISQMQQRATGAISEYQQAWNYNAGVSNGELSKDWIFVSTEMLQNDPAYTISATFPNDDNIGYSKNRVPAVPFNLPINVINFSNDGSTCPLIGDGSYIAIMLGDVDGSYSNYDADGELRGSKISSDINAEDIVLFDLQNSTISQENGNVLIDIPVTLNTNETALNALDFWMSYDESVLEFVEVSSSQMEMDAFANYNESNSVLRVTSSKDLNSLYFDTNSNISVLRFKVLNPCLEVTPDLFTATSTLLNGLPAGYDYSVRDYVVFTEITTEEIICENGAESFSTIAVVEGQNVVAYNWDLNGEEIAFGDNVSFEIGVSGLNTVSVEAFTEFGCVIVFSEEIFVNASPSAGFTIQSETGSLEVSLTNESTIEDNSILSYNWNFGDGNTSNLEDPTNVYGDYGIYEVTLLVTSENGCTSEVTQGLELITTVENVSATFTNVYPNPFNGELSVITNLDADIYVIDMLGKRVSITKTVKPNTTTVFDLSYLASGMYNLVVASENSIMTYKIVCK